LRGRCLIPDSRWLKKSKFDGIFLNFDMQYHDTTSVCDASNFRGVEILVNVHGEMVSVPYHQPRRHLALVVHGRRVWAGKECIFFACYLSRFHESGLDYVNREA